MGRKNYIYDIDTKNISFVQTAVDLKKLGIKNNMFFLKLYDPSLKGVDPHSPFLSDDAIIRIINECIINPWYYLRECARIPIQGNPKGVPYLLNRANLAQAWCFIHGIDNYLVISRQIGKTESAIAIINWAFLFGTTNSEFMFVNLKSERAVENLQKLKNQRDLLPPYLQFKVSFDDAGKIVKSTDNVKTLKNANNKNTVVTKPSARSVETAEHIGRGASQPIQYFDEFEFTPYIKTIVEASGPAFNTASTNAKANNGMYCRLITSTPGDLDSQSAQGALQIKEMACKWSEEFYSKPIDDVKEYIEINSGNGIVYIEYAYTQLGKDEAWFNKVCRLLNNNSVKIKREILLMRMRGSSESPYESEDLQAIEELKGTIKEEIFLTKLFKVDLYQALDRNKCYFIGVDVANGYGSDNSAIEIVDPYTLEVVGEFKSALIGVKDLIKVIYLLVKKHLPKSLVAVERNANGEAVLEHLRDSEIRGNLYFDSSKDLISDIDDKLDANGVLKREAARRKLYGIYTQGKAREIMFGLLEAHIREHKDKFIGRELINDIMGLVRTKSGKIEAGPGLHDDNVMAYLMCLYVYYHGNNLHRFGFVRGKLPTEEERNKGLVEDVYNALSENDKAFFEGAYDPKTVSDDIDMESLIQERKGLIGPDELSKLGNDAADKPVKPFKTKDPYMQKIINEMIEADKESEAFNRKVKFVSSYENTEYEDTEGGMDLDIFNELNDL